MNPSSVTPLSPQTSELLEGRYKLEEVIGNGGMGVVMRARQVSVDRAVAIKMLHAQHQDNDEALGRFELEARALGRLTHPGCLTIFDFGYSEQLSSYFMVTEYIDGKTLDDHLKHQSLPVSQYLDAIADTCMALAHSHKHGILHRDLKPSNIMLLSEGPVGVKVLDFGLARLYEETLGAQQLSVAGSVYGTPAYMSPEQCQGEEQITPATDVYSLGIMLYEIFEGKTPFEASNITGVLLKHVVEECPTLTSDLAPDDMKQLIAQMVSKTPENRPSDLGELSTKIRALSDQLRDVRRASTLMQYRRRVSTPMSETNLELPKFEKIRTHLPEQFDETINHAPSALLAENDDVDDVPPKRLKPYALIIGVLVLFIGGVVLWAAMPSNQADTRVVGSATHLSPTAFNSKNTRSGVKVKEVVHLEKTLPQQTWIPLPPVTTSPVTPSTVPRAKPQAVKEQIKRSRPTKTRRAVLKPITTPPTTTRAKTIKLGLD